MGLGISNFISKKKTSIEDFLEELNKISRAFEKDKSVTNLFRGQERTSWNLLPKIARPEYKRTNPVNFEKELLEEFKRLGYSFDSKIGNYTRWDLLALAQHHGLPTRLLDWTTNPLVALYFAFAPAHDDSESRSVWLFSVNSGKIVEPDDELFNLKMTKVFKPNHLNNRISAQNGWFSCHVYNSSKKKYYPLNDQSEYAGKFIRFDFDNEMRKQFLKQLDMLGINEMTLFPDLSGMSKYLEWRNFKKD